MSMSSATLCFKSMYVSFPQCQNPWHMYLRDSSVPSSRLQADCIRRYGVRDTSTSTQPVAESLGEDQCNTFLRCYVFIEEDCTIAFIWKKTIGFLKKLATTAGFTGRSCISVRTVTLSLTCWSSWNSSSDCIPLTLSIPRCCARW